MTINTYLLPLTSVSSITYNYSEGSGFLYKFDHSLPILGTAGQPNNKECKAFLFDEITKIANHGEGAKAKFTLRLQDGQFEVCDLARILKIISDIFGRKTFFEIQ
jgi:hypothetical protein